MRKNSYKTDFDDQSNSRDTKRNRDGWKAKRRNERRNQNKRRVAEQGGVIMGTLDKGLVQIALNEIGNTFFTVEFLKADGSFRQARARLNVESRMANNDLSDVARARFAKNGQIPFVDMDLDPKTDRAKGWRSFKLDSVIAIRGAKMDLRQHV